MSNHEVRLRLEERETSLSPYAVTTSNSKGRRMPEEPSPLRTEFQRDRDRILHTNAFRRLKHKTQVFIAPLGDHFTTRLTHTLEVAQIGRTIARALNLNEDLEEAICLGHDLGHTPFGHIGEETMAALAPDGFRHNHQSLRVVEMLERQGKGLNLTWEVRQGIVNHSKPRGDFLDRRLSRGLTLEAQVCRISDAVAYLNHDIGDAVRAGILREEELPALVRCNLGTRHSQRVDTLVTDIVEASWKCAGLTGGGSQSPTVTMSSRVRQAMNVLREFLFEQVYMPEGSSQQSLRARGVLSFLYPHFTSHPEEIPVEYWVRGESPERMAVDYIAGMTDQYAVRAAERLCPGVSGEAFTGRV